MCVFILNFVLLVEAGENIDLRSVRLDWMRLQVILEYI